MDVLHKPFTPSVWHALLALLVGPLLLASSIGHTVQAQDAGAGAFARVGFGAHGMALGNAVSAAPGTQSAAFYNPALAPGIEAQNISLSAALMTFDRDMQHITFDAPLGPTAGLSTGVMRAGVSDIDGRDSDGRPTETLSTDEYALFLAFGNQFWDRLAGGATLKLYFADLVDDVGTVQTLAVDLGLIYTVQSGTHIGLSVSDLLAKYEWDTGGVGGRSATDFFPVRVRVSASHRLLDDRLRLLAEYESRFTDREQRVRLPREGSAQPSERFETRDFRLHESMGRIGVSYAFVETFTVRGGIDRLGEDGINGWQPSLGFGLTQSLGTLDVDVNYAAVVEPYVTDLMNVLSVRIYL